MNDVFEKTRELGEALLRSEEYVKMKQLEDKALQNETAAEALTLYLETRGKLEEIMQQPQPDVQEMKRLNAEMEAYQAKLQELTDVVELTQAREKFNELVNQVNQVLRFILTGEMGDGKSCSGSCDTCSSQCRTLH